MRNSESGLSATSASSLKRSWAWLCAAVTMASPTSIGDPALNGTRADPRTATTSPTAKTTLPACASAALAASAPESPAARRTNRHKPRCMSLPPVAARRLPEVIAQLHSADVTRILEELEIRCIVRVLVFHAHRPVRIDKVQRAQVERQVPVVARDVDERDRRLVPAVDVAHAGVERPERR